MNVARAATAPGGARLRNTRARKPNEPESMADFKWLAFQNRVLRALHPSCAALAAALAETHQTLEVAVVGGRDRAAGSGPAVKIGR